MVDIVVISDTHGRHAGLGELRGAILIHGGDGSFGRPGDPGLHHRLDGWLARQRFGAIVAVGGNHDFEFERRVRGRAPVFSAARAPVDETATSAGLRIHVSPWTPALADWAFYGSDGRLRTAWQAITVEVDVLVTHTGPAGIPDRNRFGRSIGCPRLTAELARIRPRLHAFGHHHASAGHCERGGTLHLNASRVDSDDRIARRPWRVRLDADRRQPAALQNP